MQRRSFMAWMVGVWFLGALSGPLIFLVGAYLVNLHAKPEASPPIINAETSDLIQAVLRQADVPFTDANYHCDDDHQFLKVGDFISAFTQLGALGAPSCDKPSNDSDTECQWNISGKPSVSGDEVSTTILGFHRDAKTKVIDPKTFELICVP